MGEFNDGLPEKRPAVDFTDPETLERIRSAFLGVDPDDAGPGIRKGPDGHPIITVSNEDFAKLEAGIAPEGLESLFYPAEPGE